MSTRMEDDCGRAIGVWVEGAQHRNFSHMEWLSPDVHGLIHREGDDIGAYGNCPTYYLSRSYFMARLVFYDNFY